MAPMLGVQRPADQQVYPISHIIKIVLSNIQKRNKNSAASNGSYQNPEMEQVSHRIKIVLGKIQK
jgi:hypothetical protein